MSSQEPRGATGVATRWEARPLGAFALRAAALTVPVAASVGVAATIVSLLGPARSTGQLVGQIALVMVPATATLWLVDRLARRLLPLAALLRLSLAFPDRAPSRYATARLTNSRHELERRVQQARDEGVATEPSEAAETILALVAALNAHDRRTRGHSERTRLYTDLLAEQLGLPADERDRMRWAALVHDVGKLTVPGRILNKAGHPTDNEWDVLRSHPEEGTRLCASLLPWLGESGRAIVEHHERYDGGGYPHGLEGHQISLHGRILAVADSFEVMTAPRPYKRPMSAAEARAELARCAGTQFDPGVVRAFLGVSLGRVRLAMGPLSWLAQLPVVSRLTRTSEAAAQTGGALAGAAAISAPAWWGSPVLGAADAEPMANTEVSEHQAPVAGSDGSDGAAPGDPAAHRPHADDGAAEAPAADVDADTASDPASAVMALDPTQARSLHDEGRDVQVGAAPAGQGPDGLEDAPGGLVDDADDTVRSVVDDTLEEGRELTDTARDTLDGVVDETTDTVREVVDDATETADETVDDVTDTVEETTGTADDAAREVIDETTDTTRETVDEVTDTAVEDATDTVAETVDDVIDDTVDDLDEAADGLTSP